MKKVTWREVESWGLQKGEEFENFWGECLITVSVLLQKIGNIQRTVLDSNLEVI